MRTNKPRAVLALDVGSKRIGVAGSDSLGITAQAVETYVRVSPKRDLEHLTALALSRGAHAFVVGLPRNMDGSEGGQAADTRAFAQALEKASGLPILFEDERLTTRAAHDVLIQGNVRRGDRKKVVDKLAAVLILESYLDSLT